MNLRPLLYRSAAILALSLPLPACSAADGAHVGTASNVIATLQVATQTACTVAGSVFGWTLTPNGSVVVTDAKPVTAAPLDPG